jgi:hypothetical protein
VLRLLAAIAVVAASACSGGDDAPEVAARTVVTYGASGRVLQVPEDHPRIADAVRAAQPGDLVLIAPGVYREEVEVETPGIVLRGLDRNATILDGDHTLENGILVEADGVAVENLTVRNYALNGVLVSKAYDSADPASATPLQGYRISYVTAANNGLYGLYAFAARGGLIEHAYASGHPDSGVYVGQCKPCDAVVTDTIGELNAVGYLGTNASGNIAVVRSTWTRNRVGMMSNSQTMELLAPQVGGTFAGNLVAGNAETATPEQASGAFGVGIVIGGGTQNVVVRNVVRGHPVAGVVVTDLDGFRPEGNEVRENRFEENALDAAAYLSAAGAAPGNCFAANRFEGATLPADIQTALACGGSGAVPVGAPNRAPAPPGVDYRAIPLPGPQPQMPDAASSPARPARPDPPTIDLATITAPTEP